ncbi:CPBP family intramembrane glutamic endopeptidase [Gudongella sp. DL1XJH-153]|uniref:CPBP family intramembrane glutamic endopeptidase n=1 Tax=Gudongella sp. DL1XJH-153 TaxID=3409804 RepID=UPI003BB6217F
MLLSIPFVINVNSMGAGSKLFHGPIYLLLPAMVTNIIFGGLEEIGWREVLLPEFMKRYPTSIATLFTSLIWSFWHLPLWFINSSPQQNMNPLVFIILGLCFSLILTVIYLNTRSIFLCIITHSLFNSYSGIIFIPFTSVYLELLTMLAFSLAIYLIFMNRNKHKVKQAFYG